MAETPRVNRVGFMQYDCTFYAGELPVDETIVAAGHEPNGYFWEGMLRYLEPELAEHVELDSEGGTSLCLRSTSTDEACAERLSSLLGGQRTSR